MGFLDSLFGGSETKYEGGHNPNNEWISDERQGIVDALREMFGTENGLPADRRLNVSLGGRPVGSREHPDVSRQWDRLANFTGWGPIEAKNAVQSEGGSGIFSLLGLGLSAFGGPAGMAAGGLASGF